MRFSTRDTKGKVLIAFPALLIVACFAAVIFGVAELRAISTFLIWALLGLSLTVSIFFDNLIVGIVEPDRRMAYLDAVRSKRLWGLYRKKWALPTCGLLLGCIFFFMLGTLWSGFLGLCLLLLHSQIEDCRMRMERADLLDD